MSVFNPMTHVAAAEVVADFKSHADMELLEVQWGIDGLCETSSKSARAGSWAKLARDEERRVFSDSGLVSLERALVDTAIAIPKVRRNTAQWRKLLAALRFDGFEVVEEEISETSESIFGVARTTEVLRLVRMLPENAPETDFREAEDEVTAILKRINFTVARGHLSQAISAFQRGEWSSANGELRNFTESYLNEIADALGYVGTGDAKQRREFLGAQADPPFLLSEYNEWHENSQKPQYVQGLMSRLHPHGGHPGLSEEEDATFRLQICLITARLLLRRFSQRMAI